MKVIYKKFICCFLVILFCFLSVFFASCSNKKFVILLDYVVNTNHTGLYVAKEKGFFNNLGFEVVIKENSDNDAIKAVASGAADLGISFTEDLVAARANNIPIKSVAAILRHNTSEIVSLKNSNINLPNDWVGKKYATWGGDAEIAVLKGLMREYNVSNNDINNFVKNIVSGEDATINNLGKNIDLMWIYEGWDGVIAKAKGFDINTKFIKDIDKNKKLDYYTPLLVTSENYLNNKSKLKKLNKVMKAIKKGYEYIVNNVDESVEIMKKYIKDFDKNILKNSLNFLKDYFLIDKSENIDNVGEFGFMDKEVFNKYLNFMQKENLYKNVKAEELFTNDCLFKLLV